MFNCCWGLDGFALSESARICLARLGRCMSGVSFIFSQITESIALGRSVTAVDSVLRASWKRSWWRANSMSNTFKLVSAAICANFSSEGS